MNLLEDIKSRPNRYLIRRRRLDEATALRRVRVTAADLRAWRRDPDFREAEREMIAHPAEPSQVINLERYLHDGEQRWVAAPSEREAAIGQHIEEVSNGTR